MLFCYKTLTQYSSDSEEGEIMYIQDITLVFYQQILPVLMCYSLVHCSVISNKPLPPPPQLSATASL